MSQFSGPYENEYAPEMTAIPVIAKTGGGSSSKYQKLQDSIASAAAITAL
jgi:hypothetical protein